MLGPETFYRFTISTTNCLSPAKASKLSASIFEILLKKCSTVTQSESIYLNAIKVLHRQLL